MSNRRKTCHVCKQPLTKLTKTEVEEIFTMRFRPSEISKLVGVSRQTIWKIKTKKLYAAWTDGLVCDSVDEQEPR